MRFKVVVSVVLSASFAVTICSSATAASGSPTLKEVADAFANVTTGELCGCRCETGGPVNQIQTFHEIKTPKDNTKCLEKVNQKCSFTFDKKEYKGTLKDCAPVVIFEGGIS